mgnify:CR=1 FL=1
MRRDFVVQHPTFGRMAKVSAKGCEKSVYYWWWYALTLNSDYTALCERISNGDTVTNDERSIYDDFGDVRYDKDGFRFVSTHNEFKRWWQSDSGRRYDNGEVITRGVYLFAESTKEHDDKVRVLGAGDERASVVDDDDLLIIAIPRNATKEYANKCVTGILKRNYKNTATGKAVKSVKRSTALYSPSTHPNIVNISESLRCYELKQNTEHNGKKLSNLDIFKLAKLKYTARQGEAKTYNEARFRTKAEVNKSKQDNVTRKLKFAKKLVEDAGAGMFCTK